MNVLGRRCRMAWAAMIWIAAASAGAHEPTRQQALAAADRREAEAAAAADDSVVRMSDDQVCRLTLRLNYQGARVPGLVRLVLVESARAIPLPREIHRARNWYSIEAEATVRVPPARVRVEALHGIETLRATEEIDLTGRQAADVELEFQPLPRLATSAWTSGNTHLHLMRMSITEADRYLRLVPRGDDLDLVFVSYLRRVPDEAQYITNALTTADLARLSTSGTLFGNGEEHRHNFGPQEEGYGHVMFLNIARLIEPVSIGPGIMGAGTDGIPLQTGIRQARADRAAVVWCHNRFGLEDVPNWLAGLVDAQNIFDGGNRGSYEDSFYRYLNLGLRVPFSTGTDWFMYDFSRVYVPLEGKLTVQDWLAQLAAGRSLITNGPLLELDVDGRAIGETLQLSQPRVVKVTARGVGRLDFGGLELVHNGRVVHVEPARQAEHGFRAELRQELSIEQPGWLAVRIPWDNTTSELGGQLFAHTSPTYLEFAGRRIFRPEVAEELRQEMLAAMETIVRRGTFANPAEQASVLEVYRRAIDLLDARMEAAGR